MRNEGACPRVLFWFILRKGVVLFEGNLADKGMPLKTSSQSGGLRVLTLNRGYFILLLGLGVYIVLVVSLADFLPQHWAVQIFYALFTGFAWLYPAVKFLAFSAQKQKNRANKQE